MEIEAHNCSRSAFLPVQGAEFLSPAEFGALGEKLAVSWLCEQGWRLLGTNIHVGHCEIDALFEVAELRLLPSGAVRETRVLVVVEVKSRRTSHLGTGAEAVSTHKQASLRRAVGRWLSENSFSADEVRFDVVECTSWHHRGLVCHRIEEAF